MNIETKTVPLPENLHPMPADADLPIRSTYLHEEALRELGARLASGTTAVDPALDGLDFHARVDDIADTILKVYRTTDEAQSAGEIITPAAQWLLDNHYLIEEAIYQVKRNLPPRFYRQLPTMKTPSGRRIPRVLAIVWLYVAHTDSTVMLQSLRALVQGFQSVEPLRIGELWALPALLRFVLTENLRRLALRVNRSRSLRQMANEAADRVLATDDEAARERLLASYTRHAQDATFATQLLYRLRDGSQNSGRALSWLEAELEKYGTDAEESIILEHQTLSSGNVTMGNIVRGLRMINDTDWTTWFEGVSQIDSLLRDNTNFSDLDFQSRDQYRNAIEKMARRSDQTEYTVAKKAIELAASAGAGEADGDAGKGAPLDIGFFLAGPRRPELEKAIGYRPRFGQHFLRLYRKAGWLGLAVPIVVLTAFFLWLAAVALADAGLSHAALAVLLIILAIPAADGAVGLFNTIALMFLKPLVLIGFDFKEGLPADARTLVVIPSLIGSREDVEEIVRNLEVHYLANVRGEIYFAVLSDWPDSRVEQNEADLELLGHARKKIAELNSRHPKEGVPRFHLLHRRRLYSESEHCWMGWERKRGKLHELNLLLRGDADTTFFTPEALLPDGVVYVMTLDVDTRTTRDVVKRLAGKLAHPLNRPVFDRARRVVTSGYGILQPRVTASLTTGNEASFFQRVFSANRGMDPYVFAVSDVYQDIYGEGTFTGKGLYHVDAMEAALAGRIDENSVLSHDLLEGALARAALVSDVEVVEDYPTRYSVDASRHHRWARGDWQLLSFISASGVPAISRWKMIDNLRRTLTPIFWVASSVTAWTLLPFALAAQWQLFLILILFVAPTFDIVAALLPERANVTLRGHFHAFGRDVAFGTAQVALRMVLIAHSAWLMGDAIVRTFHRLFVSHENLLEWRTALQAQRGNNDLQSYYRLMGGALVIAVAGFVIPFAAGSSGMFVALIFALFWFVSPAFAWLVSRSAETEDRLVVSPEDRQALRVAARRQWLFFETFVTEGDHWLPPDNFQETPHPVVAHRTSPTNISVYMLSTIAARDFGWIGMGEAIARLENTLDTIDKLDTFRGHIYNWYDTETLQPLHPRYISAVDNGNFAGHLVAIAAACNEWAMAPAAYMEGDFDGLLDVVTILDETLDALPDDRRPLRPLRQRLRDRIAGMRRAVEAIKREPEMAAVRTINLAVMAAEIRKLAGAVNQETESAASADLSLWADKLAAACDAHVDDAHTDETTIEDFRARLKALGTRCRSIAFGMDFSFLLREDRKLLSIGYRMADHQLDEACYDLLASEARLASLFSIAKGDVPTDHWFHLGRPIVEIGFRGALMSWSGSMFEYLMPPLVMKEPQGGILNQTSHLIIKRQIQYGHEKRIPWGISEAAFNARDREMNYQYTNFGVPGLGLKRGLALNTVIAPYATLLASQFMPREAVQNLRRLRALGACGRYGYHDAVDFTPQRVPEGTDHAVVYNYFAHHSGMSIAAVANVVFEGRMRDRFHSDPVIESAELLLQEKAPRSIPAATLKTEAVERAKGDTPVELPDTRLVLDPLAAIQATNLVSNGRYSVMVTAAGSGYSRYNDLAVTRWQADPVEDRLGTYLFLKDAETGEWWSATAEPKQAAGETIYTLMSDDKTSFVKTVGTLRSEVECIVVSEGNGEGRRITISNDGATERIVEVTSYAELVLAPEAADNAHPAFSKMFVETEIARQNAAIFATRRKRDKHEADIALAHFVTDSSGSQREGEAETDRRNFIGRGRTLSDAAAFDTDARLVGGQGFVLDPIAALRRRVRVAPNKKVVLTFWTVVGADREEVEASIGRIDHADSFARQSMLSWTRSQVQTHHVGLTLAEAANVQKLARYLIYPDKWMRRPAEAIASGLSTQAALWPLGISGDFPIFAIRIGDQADLEIVANALRMQEYLRARGLVVDLVVVNEQASTYVQDLQHAIEALCENSRARGREHGPREHIFAVRRDLIDKKSYRTLVTVARVVVHTRNGTIFDQIERAEAIEMQAKGITPPSSERALPEPMEEAKRPVEPVVPPVVAEPPSGDGLQFWNGFGGFDEGSGDYLVRLTGTRTTPHPWINVVANQGFGFHTSAEGASFTWSRNSRDFQLTPWSNDPVCNRPGEAIYIHDFASGKAFSPFAAMARDPAVTYETRHGRGFSTFHAIRDKLAMEVTQLVDSEDPVKISRLILRNGGFEPARLRVYTYAEWVFGTNRSKSGPTIIPSQDAAAGVLMARNAYSLDFAERFAFMAADRPADSVSADRLEFLGRKGSSVLPETVLSGAALSGTVEAGGDPCAAMAYDIEIAPGEEATLLWLMGDASSPEEAAELVKRNANRDFDGRLAETKKAWDGFLDTVQVETPDKALDLMVNHWLPYQALACRIRARTAFYQASGAYGFRDQLQDTLAMVTHDPSLTAAQIENAAGRQFLEGDFQHWWLPRTGAGVRTTISDDVVWLAYGAAYYMKVTGDRSILDREVSFITGEPLKEGEHDSFFTPSVSDEKATIYEHAARGLDLAIKRTGATGLPLILGGDWNDGMNSVGDEGKGESVWLGWFLLKALDDFIPVARERKDDKRASRWAAHAEKLAKALNGSAWDGEWYRRGSYDDGTPLGSHLSDECRIDSIAQSWSVLSGRGDPEHAEQAMDSATRFLVDEEFDIVRLFTPAFNKTPKEPGYIKSYPPGVRENGGQYTHAATWFVIALAELGRADEAWQVFRKLNPVEHSLDETAAERYRVEPYVVAADIYGSDDKGGRGGWTWYTGSAGWLYRAAVEGILGIRKEADRLVVAPALPGDWEGFSAVLRPGKAIYRIRVVRGDAATVEIGGKKSAGNSFGIEEEGTFDVLVTVTGERAAAARTRKGQRASAAE
jgi:cyclic beta-1,2-glucan synthetase